MNKVFELFKDMNYTTSRNGWYRFVGTFANNLCIRFYRTIDESLHTGYDDVTRSLNIRNEADIIINGHSRSHHKFAGIER